MEQRLQFRADGTFTIVQFTDIHWQNGKVEDEQTRALMERVLQSERPDLIVFTGDVIYDGGCDNPAQSFRDAVAVAELNRIPWAAVFGNHDAEARIERAALMDVQLSHRYTIAKHSPGISGYGNYTAEITGRGGRTEAVCYFIDSGDYSKLERVEGYNWIRRDQIQWYCNESGNFTARNGGYPLPALAFFHIPLQEYKTVWETRVCYGNKYEDVCSARINSGLFAAMVEHGDVMGTFVGHDHVNDYWGELHGIRLCYGRATGYNTYGREGFPCGARIIRLTEGERSFESWLRLDDGTVVLDQPEHRPEQN